MKQNLFKTLFLLLGASSALSAVAYDVHVGDGYYNLNKTDGTARLTYLEFYSEENAAAYVGDLVLPSTFEYEGTTYTVTAVESRAFYECNNLITLELPATVTEIGNNAFFNCTALKHVKLPEALTKMDYSAFQCCSALESVEFPSSLLTVGSTAYSDCSSLREVTFTRQRVISNNAFRDCVSLDALDFPQSLTTIDHHAFAGCTNLKTLTFPDGVTGILTSAFQDCKGLASIEFGKSLSTLDVNAFTGCTLLADVYCTSPTPPGDVYSSAFNGTPLTRLHLPNEGIEAYHKQDLWKNFKSILPLQCATPSIELHDQSLTFTTTTNLNYTDASEKFIYSIEVSDISSGTITNEEMEAFGELALTYDILVKATAEGCADSGELAAQLCWVGSDFLFGEEEEGNLTGITATPSQRPVLATSRGGEITLSGLADGERAVLYDLSGRQIATASAVGGSTQFSAASGQIVVVRVGNTSFKVRVN